MVLHTSFFKEPVELIFPNKAASFDGLIFQPGHLIHQFVEFNASIGVFGLKTRHYTFILILF